MNIIFGRSRSPLGLIASVLLLSSMFFIGPSVAQITTLGFKNALVQFLLEQLSVPGEFEITAGEVDEPGNGVTRLSDVAIADAQGVWLTVESVSFQWNPQRLLRGEVEIETLDIAGFTMSRSPAAEEAPAETDPMALGELEIAWPRSPIPLNVKRFALERVSIAEGVLPQAIRFDGSGRVVDDGPAQIFDLTLTRTDAIDGRIRLAYTRRFDDDTLALDLDANEAPGGLVAAAAGFPETSAARLIASAEGPPSDWRVTLNALVDEVFDLNGRAEVSYAGPIAVDASMALTPGAAIGDSLREALSPQAEIVARLNEAENGLVVIDEAVVRAPDFDATLSGDYSRTDGRFDFALSAEARAELSRLFDGVAFERLGFAGDLDGGPDDFRAVGDFLLTGLETEAVGVSDAQLNGSVAGQGETISINLSGDAGGLRIDRLTPDIIGPAALAAEATWRDETLALETATLRSDVINAVVSGEARVADETVDLIYDISSEAVRPVAAAYDLNAEGVLQIVGSLRGPFAEPAFSGSLRLGQTAIDGRRFGDIEATHALVLGDPLAGELTAMAGQTPFGPINTRADLTLDGDLLSLKAFRLDAVDAVITGDLDVDLATTLADGAVKIAANDLRTLGRALDMNLSGALNADATVASEQSRQTGSARFTARSVSIDDALVIDAEGVATASDLNALTGLVVDASANLRDASGNALASTEASASGSADDLAIEATATGEWREQPANLSMTGRVTQAADVATLALNTLAAQLTTPEETFRAALQSRTEIILRDGALSTTPMQLQLPRGGRVNAELARTSAGYWSGDARLENLALTLARDLFDASLDSGVIDAITTFDTRPNQPSADIGVTMRDFRVQGAANEADALALDVNGDWNGERADLSARITGSFGDPFIGRVSAPVTVGPDFAVSTPPGGQIDGELDWRGDIETLWAFVPAPGHLLSGRTIIDLALSGVIDDPIVSGRLAVEDGRYANLLLGTTLEALSLESRVSQEREVQLELRATDGGEGSVASDIALDLVNPDREPSDAQSVNVSVTMENAMLVRRDDVKARFSGDVSAVGSPLDLFVNGGITVDGAEIRLLDTLPPTVVDLGDVRFTDEEVDPNADVEAEPIAEVGLDVTIDAPGEIFVRGRGVDAEWGGRVEIAGTADQPRLSGSIERIRGTLDLLGRRFDLSRGAIVFQGRDQIDPTLDIAFAREVDGLEGRIEVTGSATAPGLGFASTPAIPEDEVLPRVLFGQSKQSLSPAEAIQLAAGVATLASGDDGLVGTARETLGLQVLQFDSDEDGGSSVTAGRYVADDVFVGTRQSLDGKGGAAIVELEVIDNVTVDAEVGQNAGSSVGATWRYDF